jgi:threonine dehydrogenase-like Zn-dependent dehydrogenase
MRALVWDGERARVVDGAPEPECPHGTALVQVLAAGICSTDLQILKGYMHFRGILGHELVGRVAVGPQELSGRRVVAEINFACGRCPACGAGRARHCPTRTVMGILGADGAFADFVRVPVENLHPIPDALSDREAVFVEPLAAAFRAEEQTRGHASGRTIVLGAGKLGLLVAQVLSRRGDDVSVVYRSESGERRLRMLGLKAVPRERATPGADLVVDASGSAQGLAAALDLVRPLGAVVMKSTIAAEHQLALARLVIDEVTLVGSRCGPFPPALDALAAGDIRVEPLVDAVLPLGNAVEALERAAQPGAGKVLLQP